METKVYKIVVAIVVIMAAIAGEGCTRNNGDIGPWFGTWGLTEATGDYSVPGADRSEFLQFQSGTVCLRVVFNETTSYDAAFGNWSESGGVLTLDFPDQSDEGWHFAPYGFARHSQWRWTIDGGRLTLSDANGTLTFTHVP